MEKSHWVMDYETICNCFIAVFEHYKTEEKKLFVVCEQQNDFLEFVTFLQKCVTENQWHISYNGLAFDAQITQYILDVHHKLKNLDGKSIAEVIYKFAQETINKTESGSFATYSPNKLKIRQIDLFKLNHWDNKAKMSSLKWIQYSMDWENVEEMPHPHYEPITNNNTLQEVIEYCINDVQSTKKILEHSKEQIQLRQTLTKEYNIDLYSASEPRISKELFLHFLSKKLGWNKAEIKTLRTPRQSIILADCILPYIKFDTLEFNKMLDYFRTKVIMSTKDGFKYTADFKGVKIDYGLGGIHGAVPTGVYEAKPGWVIMTSDVTSYYPNLAIKNHFHPKHIPQKEFGELYEWFFEERKKIPKSDPKNYVYKIILNSTYGLTGDENSFLYDPKMTMQITINGQLLLSKLAEMLSLAIPECQPLMLNTDGLEMMIPDNRVEDYMKVCAEWEKLTQLALEHDQYSKMVIGDVNNYIAIYKNGKVKCKGRFEWEDLEKKKVAMFHKNKSFLIIPKALYAYFVNGILPEDFLAQNQNIYDYCGAVKAKSGWHFEERKIQNGIPVSNKLQKIIRYYISANGYKLVKCHKDGREIQVEAGQWMQNTVNQLSPNFSNFDSYNIDLKYYIENIYKEITQIEKLRPKAYAQLTLF
jgi:DNA polymerase elongation subunit (family B)